jgi:hypothetical protein
MPVGGGWPLAPEKSACLGLGPFLLRLCLWCRAAKEGQFFRSLHFLLTSILIIHLLHSGGIFKTRQRPCDNILNAWRLTQATAAADGNLGRCRRKAGRFAVEIFNGPTRPVRTLQRQAAWANHLKVALVGGEAGAEAMAAGVRSRPQLFNHLVDELVAALLLLTVHVT